MEESRPLADIINEKFDEYTREHEHILEKFYKVFIQRCCIPNKPIDYEYRGLRDFYKIMDITKNGRDGVVDYVGVVYIMDQSDILSLVDKIDPPIVLDRYCADEKSNFPFAGFGLGDLDCDYSVLIYDGYIE